MDSKTIAAIIVFTALALVLTLLPFKIPAPYATFLIYQIWEIPIVVAFLLYGPKVGVTASIVNTIALLIIFPGELPTGPFYNLAAVLSMLSGIYLIMFTYRIVRGKAFTEAMAYLMLTMISIVGALVQNLWWLLPGLIFGLFSIIAVIERQRESVQNMQTMSSNADNQYDGLSATASTVAGAFSRVIIMSVINLTFLPFPPPVGFSMPQEVVIGMLPLVGFFNATLALYTIPIGHIIAKIVSSSLKIVGYSKRT